MNDIITMCYIINICYNAPVANCVTYTLLLIMDQNDILFGTRKWKTIFSIMYNSRFGSI